MEIGKVRLAELQLNHRGMPLLGYGQLLSCDKINFTSAKVDVLEKEMIELLPNKKGLKFLLGKCKEFVGEKASILITAAGTGLVAPLSIAFNPFMKAPKDATPEKKEDVKKNKIYSAWRQPISAVLAVIFQFGALKPIDRYLDERFNNPKYSSGKNIDVDMQAINKKSYIERIEKSKMKAENKSYASRKEFKAELEKRVKAIEKRQLEAVANDIIKTGQIHVGNRTLGNDVVAKLFNNQMDKYIADAVSFKILPEKDIKNHSMIGHSLEFYKQRATTLVNNEELLKDVLSPEKLPTDSFELKIYLKELAEETKDPDLKQVFQEIIDTPEALKESRCQRTLERINKIKNICGGEFTPEKYINKMIDDNSEISKFAAIIEDCKIKNPAEATAEELYEAMRKFAKNCAYGDDPVLSRIYRNTETFSDKADKVKKKLATDIAKAYKTITENKYKSFSQISKIFIGVCITLPITCTALNWVYPRFMDLFFPKLSEAKKGDNKKAEGGNK